MTSGLMEHVPVQGGGTPPQHPKIQRAHPNSSRFGLQTSNDTPLVDEAGLVAGVVERGRAQSGGLGAKGRTSHTLFDG